MSPLRFGQALVPGPKHSRLRAAALNYSALAACVIAAWAAGLIGCATPNQSRYHAQVVGQENVPRDGFGRGEAIQLVLNGYRGQSATFYIQSTSSGSIVWQQTSHIPSTWHGIQVTVGNLASGSYFSWAEIGGQRVGSWSFSVR